MYVYSVCRCGHRGAEAPASVVHLMTMTMTIAEIGEIQLHLCGATHLQTASYGAHYRRTAEPALAARPGTCRVQSCRAHVQGLKRPRTAVPVVGFHLGCRRAVSTPTPLGVHRPVAGAVLPAVNDRTEGIPHRWCTCLERSSL